MIRSAKGKPISLLAITEGGLRRLYRLSPIAARVALAIADGEKVEQIAASLRLTPDTALLHQASSSEDRRLRATGPMKAYPGVLVRQEKETRSMLSQRLGRVAVNASSVPTRFQRALLCSVMAAAFLGAAASDALAAGSISGQVKDSGTTIGIANAQVQFYDFNSNDNLPAVTTTADGNGHYTQNLPDGTYAVITHAPGTYINQIWSGISCSAVCNIGQKGANITTITIAGNAVVNIDFALVSGGGRVAGMVTSSATGLPLAGVTVLLLDGAGNVPFASAVTNAAGQYLTDGGSVTGNVLVVTLNSQGYQDESYDNHKCPSLNCNVADPVAVTMGATTNNINFALDLGGRISGKVTDANGNPLANVKVRIDDPTGSKVDVPVTDGAGNFISTGLATGTYYAGTKNVLGLADIEWTNFTCPGNSCNPANGTPISVTAPNTTSGIDFALPAGATIGGTVTAAAGGAPVANTFVSIFDATGNFIGGASTGNAGAYTTGVLPTGQYFAAVSSNDVPAGFVAQVYNHMSCPNNNCAFTSGTPISVTANTSVGNINFALLATGNGSITGHVTDSSLNGVIAQVVLVGMNGAQQVATVNSNAAAGGAYTFSNVAAGSYYVRTNSSSLINKVYPNIVCISCNSMTSGGHLVTVTNGLATAGIDFALDSGGHISGTITNSAGGAAIANIGVQIFNAAGVGLGQVNANGSGVYTSTGLPAGTYYARTTNIQGFVNQQWKGLDCPQTACPPTAGTPIVVSGTATTSGIDFSLTMGGRISGTLTDATTQAPITFQAVTLFSSAGINLGNVNTDASGNYTSQGLPPGTYFARTATGTIFLNNQIVGYIDQLWNSIVCVPACQSPTAGTPIVVTSGATTSGINFALTAAGSVSGTVVDAGALTTGLPSVGVLIYTATGAFAKGTTTNNVGGFTVGGLPAGTYYARTSSGPNQFYQDELYREMPCGAGCTVTAGTPIIVPLLGMANGVDFTLSPGAGSISGTVTDAVTSTALGAVAVQIYTSDGTLVKSANSNFAGTFSVGGLTPGTYYARTAVIAGSVYDDQVFDGKVCGGTCSVTTGTPIVVAANAIQSGVDFKLTVHVPPMMALDHSALIFTAINSGAAFTAVTAGQAVRMTQTGTGTVTWTALSNQPWLVVSPTSGTGSVTFSVSTQFVAGLASTQAGSITINLTGASGGAGPITVVLNTITPASAQPPFGSFDTPTNGAAGVAGSIAVTGWGLDGVGVTRVTVCRDAVAPEVAPVDPNCAGNAQIYIGDAVFVDGARPDVQGLYSTLPLSSRAGWGYLLLTNFLPNLGNGTFNLRAYAFDVEGLTTALGVKTITCDNKHSTAPFGAIDVPGQGAVTSGVVGNTGWVLAQAPNHADPPDGGTVSVFVDGNNVGSPGLWNARPDLTALFPAGQYPGIGQALGIFGLDTTTLANGVHTIFWLVTGTGLSGTQGIGSRFFSVSNGAELLDPTAAATVSSPAATVIASRSTLDIPAAASARIVSAQILAAEIAAAPSDLSAVQGRRGFDLDLPLRTYTPSSGAIDVQAEELDRLELHLGSAGQYTGYLQTAGGLKPLPVGSSLDASTGTFTWMPGVGFYGTYTLTFVRWSGANAVARQDVRITLNAKGSNRVGPQTVIDAPKSGATVGSPFFVGGWAADLSSTVDSGVNTVHVWAYPIDARGNRLDPIFIGPAIYGGARPDVAAVYGERFEDSGYGIIVNGLAPGTYDIAVFAYSTIVNTFTPAAVVRVTVR